MNEMRPARTRLAVPTVIVVIAVAVAAAAVLAAPPVAAGVAAPSAPTTGATAAAAPSAPEVEALELINAERRARGAAPLRHLPALADIAREWSTTMSIQGTLSHRRDLVEQVERRVSTSWRRVAENVGSGTSIPSLHARFMSSTGHRANILGDFNAAGVGVVERGGRLWVTVVFLNGDSAVQTVAAPGPGGFCDTHGSVHGDAIAELTDLGIVRGADGCFGPDRTMTRGQAATVLKRALGLSTGSASFCDIAGTVHEGSIRMVASAGIAHGMPDGCFRPDQGVTRAQMAAFLARAFDLSADSGGFPDTAGHAADAEIAAVAEAGIALGDDDGLYHPGRLVTRAQMASFLVRALDATGS